jgi:hypothetical protein
MQSVQFLGGTVGDANSVFADNIVIEFIPKATGGGGGNMHAVPLPPGIYGAPFVLFMAWFAGRTMRSSNTA